MTCGAFLSQRFIDHYKRVILHLHLEMTFCTGHFLMCAVELVGTVAVMHKQQIGPQREFVAFVATNQIFFTKLAAMNIAMAHLATLIGKDEQHFPGKLARGLARVAAAAMNREMTFHQRKARLLMLCQSKLRWHESFDSVAALAFALIGAFGKLSAMHVLVAIATELVRQLLFEIAGNVAFFTFHLAMPAAQRKVRHIMIECAHAGNLHPAFRVMAFHAIEPEAAAMRILMARNAIGKRQPGVLYKNRNRLVALFLPSFFFKMAFGARYLFMPAGEQKLRLIVGKFRRRFPCREVVTTLARIAKLPTMLIPVTGHTLLGKAKKCFFPS